MSKSSHDAVPSYSSNYPIAQPVQAQPFEPSITIMPNQMPMQMQQPIQIQVPIVMQAPQPAMLDFRAPAEQNKAASTRSEIDEGFWTLAVACSCCILAPAYIWVHNAKEDTGWEAPCCVNMNRPCPEGC